GDAARKTEGSNSMSPACILLSAFCSSPRHCVSQSPRHHFFSTLSPIQHISQSISFARNRESSQSTSPNRLFLRVEAQGCVRISGGERESRERSRHLQKMKSCECSMRDDV